MDEYLVPTGYGEDEFIEKKSRFIGRVWPVETEAEALEAPAPKAVSASPRTCAEPL